MTATARRAEIWGPCSLGGLALLLLAACQSPTAEAGARHALFATETSGALGGGHPAAQTTWSLEAQAAQVCPGGYRRLDEQQHGFSEGTEWVWWVRCGTP